MARWWVWLGVAACSGASPTGTTDSGTPTGTTGDTAPAAPTQEEVQAAIDAANHCVDASDCTDLGSHCPFGCWILVHVDEAAAVQATIDAYYAAGGSTCTYSCASRGPIECNAGVCEAEATY